MFDSRAFNLPKDEVTNYFIYRQMDARRNSLQALAQSMFSHKELTNKNSDDMKTMVMEKANINYDELPSLQKYGFAVYKVNDKWIIDKEIPDFRDDRDYIEKWLL